MTNPYYNHSSAQPAAVSRGASSPIRAELDAIANAFEALANALTDTGTANAIVVSMPAAITAVADGLTIKIKLANAVTAAATVQLGSLGTYPLRRPDGSVVTDPVAGQVIEATYVAGTLQYSGMGAPTAGSGLPTTGGTMTGAINEAKGADIPSAATINLTAATGNLVHITGTTTITAITVPVGAERTVIFDGALTLTHGASLLLPGLANITTAANDRMIVRGDTSGATVISYTKANGTAIVTGITTVGASVTDNYTITGATPTIWPCATTAIGKCLTAPAITTIMPLGLFAVIDNAEGGYSVGWRDSTGALVGKNCVAPGGIAHVYLEDNTTAAGTWRIEGTNLEPGLISIDNTFSSTYASTVLAPFVALDDNTSIHFAALSTGFAAFLVDNTGKAVSTPVTVASGGTRTVRTAFKVSSTSAIVFYDDANNNSWAVVLTLTGSTPSYSLSVGSAAVLTSATQLPWIIEDFSGAPKVAQLSSTLYLASFTHGTNTGVLAVSVSGAAVTFGSVANIITTNSVANSTTTYALTATTALVIYLSGAGAPYAVNAVVVSVSGTACTVGTPASSAGLSGVTTPPSSCLLSSTKALIAASITGAAAGTIAATVSGTTVSLGSVFSAETGAAGLALAYTESSATRYNPHLFPLSSSTALLWYLDSGGISRAVVLTESGGTVTAGTILYRSISGAASNADQGGQIFPQGTTEFLALKQETGSTLTVCRFRAVAHKISGTAVTVGSVSEVSSISPSNAVVAAGICLSRLSSGDYVVLPSANGSVDSIPVFRSNGDAINNRGAIGVPALNGGAFALPSVASNRLVFLGYTQYSGTTAGASTYQLRLLNIEIAQ